MIDRLITKTLVVSMTVVGLFVFQNSGAFAEDFRNPSVGVTGRIEQIVIPGPELQAKPITDPDSPMIVRIAEVFPHGDAWRYDIEFSGRVPGKFDLADYLMRVADSDDRPIPPIEVEILSLLPPGQIEPNELGRLPNLWLGGYRLLVIAAVIGWILVMGLILFAGRKRKKIEAARVKPKTLADYLKPRIEKAVSGELNSREQAELERMLVAFWTRKLGLQDDQPAIALKKIKNDSTAGPLVLQLERWMHDPQSRQNASLPELLEPYKNISFDEEFSAAHSGTAVQGEVTSV